MIKLIQEKGQINGCADNKKAPERAPFFNISRLRVNWRLGSIEPDWHLCLG